MDIDLCTYLRLEGLRADVPQCAMTQMTVVVGLNLLEYGFTRVGPIAKSLATDAIDLQDLKEALGTGIFLVIAFGAHAAPQLMTRSNCWQTARAILAPSVIMQ